MAAGVLAVNILQPTEGGAVFEIASVLPEHKSYFNEGKILLFAEEVQINGEGGKLIPEFRKRFGKFVAPILPWSRTCWHRLLPGCKSLLGFFHRVRINLLLIYCRIP